MKKVIGTVEAVYYYLKSSYKMWLVRKGFEDDVIYTTKQNVEICVYPGTKKQSPHDFKVKYKEPNKRERTPKHVHLIVEMYVKFAYNSSLTLELRDHLLKMFENIRPISSFPPNLQFFKPEHLERFSDLDNVGEFPVEFLLVVTELIGIQEKTNYPEGSLTEGLYKDFGVKDRFSVIQKATWRQ